MNPSADVASTMHSDIAAAVSTLCSMRFNNYDRHCRPAAGSKSNQSLVLAQVYRILLQHTAMVQPLSCDEAFLDVTGLGDPEEVAAAIRAEIEAETRCTASAGVSHNLLLARLATKAAKPNGLHCITPSQACLPLGGLLLCGGVCDNASSSKGVWPQ